MSKKQPTPQTMELSLLTLRKMQDQLKARYKEVENQLRIADEFALAKEPPHISAIELGHLVDLRTALQGAITSLSSILRNRRRANPSTLSDLI